MVPICTLPGKSNVTFPGKTICSHRFFIDCINIFVSPKKIFGCVFNILSAKPGLWYTTKKIMQELFKELTNKANIRGRDQKNVIVILVAIFIASEVNIALHLYFFSPTKLFVQPSCYIFLCARSSYVEHKARHSRGCLHISQSKVKTSAALQFDHFQS